MTHNMRVQVLDWRYGHSLDADLVAVTDRVAATDEQVQEVELLNSRRPDGLSGAFHRTCPVSTEPVPFRPNQSRFGLRTTVAIGPREGALNSL